MNDQMLFDMVGDREKYKARIALLTKKVDKINAAVIKEMERRGTTALENDDWRISYVEAEKVEYDLDALAERVTPAQLKRMTTRVLDLGKLSGMIQSGALGADVVAEASTIKKNKPYIRVSPG